MAQSARTGSQDDFLGSLDIPVRDIPATAVEKWYKLDGEVFKYSLIYIGKFTQNSVSIGKSIERIERSGI